MIFVALILVYVSVLISQPLAILLVSYFVLWLLLLITSACMKDRDEYRKLWQGKNLALTALLVAVALPSREVVYFIIQHLPGDAALEQLKNSTDLKKILSTYN